VVTVEPPASAELTAHAGWVLGMVARLWAADAAAAQTRHERAVAPPMMALRNVRRVRGK
jgi:hypothetical protein